LDPAEVLLLRLGSSSRTTVSGRNAVARLRSEISSSRRRTARPCQWRMPGCRFRGHDDAPAERLLDIDRRAVGSMSTSATRMTVFSALDSAAARPGKGFLSTEGHPGKRSDLPLKRSASGSAVRRA